MLLKAILLGSQGVGKSQLLHRMCTGTEFDPFSSPTTHPDFSSFTTTLSTKEDVLVQLWDLPGNIGTAMNEKKDASSLLSILVDVHVVLLVCDLTCSSSLKYLSNLITLVEAVNQHRSPPDALSSNTVDNSDDCINLNPKEKLASRNTSQSSPLKTQTTTQTNTQTPSPTNKASIGYILLINKSEPHLRSKQQVTPAMVTAFCTLHHIDRVFETSTALDTNIAAVRIELAQYGAVISRQRRGLAVDPHLWRRRMVKQLDRLEALKQHQLLLDKAEARVAAELEEQLRLEAAQREIEETEKRKPPPPDPVVVLRERLEAMWGVDDAVRWVFDIIGSKQNTSTSTPTPTSTSISTEDDSPTNHTNTNMALMDGFDLETIARIRRLVCSWEAELAQNVANHVPVMQLYRSDRKREVEGEDVACADDSVMVCGKPIPSHHVNVLSSAAVTISRNIFPQTSSHISISSFALILRRLGVSAWCTGETPLRLYALFLTMGSALSKSGTGPSAGNKQQQVQHLMRVAMAKASLDGMGTHNNTNNTVKKKNDKNVVNDVDVLDAINTDILNGPSPDSLVALSSTVASDHAYLLQLQQHALDIDINLSAVETVLSFPVLMFGLHALIFGSVRQKAEIAWSCIAGHKNRDSDVNNTANHRSNHLHASETASSANSRKQSSSKPSPMLPPIGKPRTNTVSSSSASTKTSGSSVRPRKSATDSTSTTSSGSCMFQPANTTNIVEIERFLMSIIVEGPVAQRVLSACGNVQTHNHGTNKNGVSSYQQGITQQDLARRLKPLVLKSVDKLMSMLGKRYSYTLTKTDFINGVMTQPDILTLWELNSHCHLKNIPDEFFIECVNHTNLISDVLLHKMCEIGENVTAYKDSLTEYKETLSPDSEMKEQVFDMTEKEPENNEADLYDEETYLAKLNDLKKMFMSISN